MRPSLTPLPLLLALPLAGIQAAEDVGTAYTLRLQPGAWIVQMTGEFAYQDGGLVVADDVDVDDLDLGDYGFAPMIEAGLRLPLLFDIYAGVYSFGVDADVDISDPFTFGDTTFTGAVSSDLSMVDAYAELDWRFIPNFDLVGASVGLAVHVLMTDVEVSSNGAEESFDEVIPIPALALRVYVNPIAELSVEGRLHAMAISVGDVDATFVDIAAQATWRPWEHCGFVGGLRYLLYDIEYDFGSDEEGKVDLGLFGPYLGVSLQF